MHSSTPPVSIIVPCFNCARTLSGMLNSIKAQRLSVPFELILVNDGSTDSTPRMLQEFAQQDGRALAVSHGQNRGAGAARNTGIARARGRYLLCFDADDLLHEGALESMYRRLEESDFDGVTFEGAFSFKTRPSAARFQSYLPSEKGVSLRSVFDGTPWPVGANFMYRRRVFEIVGGYLENNNFDTQGFGIRFLAHGLKAAAAPGAFFYQRQFGREPSYFERAYSSGEFSVGFFLIFEHLFPLFSQSAREAYLGFPILSESRFGSSLLGRLQEVYLRDPDAFFEYVRLEEAESAKKGAQHPWETVLGCMAGKDWAGAAAAVIRSREAGVHPEVLEFTLRRILRLSTTSEERLNDNSTTVRNHGLQSHEKNLLREGASARVLRKMRRLLFPERT